MSTITMEVTGDTREQLIDLAHGTARVFFDDVPFRISDFEWLPPNADTRCRATVTLRSIAEMLAEEDTAPCHELTAEAVQA